MENNFTPFEVMAAIRFLREGIVQTLLTIVGVAVGVSVIVFMSALLSGLQNNIVNRVLSTQAQVVILPLKEVATPSFQENGAAVIRTTESRSQRRTTIDQWRKLRNNLSAEPGVDVVSPTAAGPVFIYHGASVRSVTLTGVDPSQYFRYVDIPGDIIAGDARITNTDILIGKDLAEDLGIKAGDKILLTSSVGGSTNLNVRGIFDLGNKGFNSRSVFATLSTAQGLLGDVGQVTTVDLTLKDPYSANDVADMVAGMFPVEADSWIRTNAQFFTAIHAQTISSAVIRLSVALSVALGIASVLVVSVVQRSSEIGILRAMGASRGQIMRLFLVQGGIVGLIGSLFGSAIARSVLYLWLIFARNPDGTTFFVISIEPTLYLSAALLATICGVLAAVLPALRASQLDPVVAIRG